MRDLVTTPKGNRRTAVTASDARARLSPLIEQMNDDAVAIEIVSKHGSAVLVPAELWTAMAETGYLLRSPANARALSDSTQQARDGNVAEHELIDPDV